MSDGLIAWCSYPVKGTKPPPRCTDFPDSFGGSNAGTGALRCWPPRAQVACAPPPCRQRCSQM